MIDDAAAGAEVTAASGYNRSLIEASLDPLMTIGVDGTITDVNEATVRATGVGRDTLIGREFASCFTEPDRAAAAYRLGFELGAVTDYPLTIRHRDGRLIDVVCNASVFRDDSGRVAGVFAAARDVTMRVAAEEELRATNRRLALLSATNQALLRTEAEADLLHDVCELITRVGGYRMAWIGRPVPEGKRVVPLAESGFEQGYLQRADITWDDSMTRGRGPTGRAVRERTVQYCRDFLRDPAMEPWRADAIKRGYASSLAVPFTVEDDLLVLTVYSERPDEFPEEDRKTLEEIADDLSVRVAARRAREQLAQRTMELERSNEELDNFVHVVSHDLRQPINTINGFCHLLARAGDGLDGKAREYIQLIVTGMDRMQALLDNLLTYSRLTTPAQPPAAVDMNAVADEVTTYLAETIRATSATITTDPLPTLTGDAVQLAQLLQNLLVNAVKFVAPGVRPRVHVSVSRLDTAWQFVIADNGIGIEPKSRDRAFTMFQRLHTEQEYSGQGIGLAFCKKIVQRHGGRIWIEDNPGGGSRFCFTIPDSAPSRRGA